MVCRLLGAVLLFLATLSTQAKRLGPGARYAPLLVPWVPPSMPTASMLPLWFPRWRARVPTPIEPDYGSLLYSKPASQTNVAKHLTKPFKKLATKLWETGKHGALGALLVTDLLEVLVEISKKGGGLEQCGFGDAAKHLIQNVKKLSEQQWPGGSTVDDVLKHEAVKHEKSLQSTFKGKRKPAVLEETSLAMALGWCMRILGFIGEMFELRAVGQNGERLTLVKAGHEAYTHRIDTAFDQGVMSPDFAIRRAIRFAITKGLSERELTKKIAPNMEKFPEVVKQDMEQDMEEFSRVVLPIVDGIWDRIAAFGLDDSKGERQPEGQRQLNK